MNEPAERDAHAATRRSAIARALIVGFALAGLAALWRLSPLAEWMSPEGLAEVARPLREATWGPVIAFVAFAIGGTLMVPITALIVANALLFEPLPALAAAIPGILVASALGYAGGKGLWRETIERIAHGRFAAVNDALGARGLLPVAAIRLVPVAPFAVVNLVAGASKLRFRDFIGGTALAMIPGTVVMTFTADNIAGAVRDPSPASVGVSLALLAVLVLGGRALTRLVERRRETDPSSAPEPA